MIDVSKKMKDCSKKTPNQCHCAFRCLGNEFCNDAENKIDTLETQLQAKEQECNEALEKLTKLYTYLVNAKTQFKIHPIVIIDKALEIIGE